MLASNITDTCNPNSYGKEDPKAHGDLCQAHKNRCHSVPFLGPDEPSRTDPSISRLEPNLVHGLLSSFELAPHQKCSNLDCCFCDPTLVTCLSTVLLQSHLFLSSRCCCRACLTSQDLLGRQGRRHGSQILTFC